MTDVLRIGHGNGHNKASLVKYVRDADADSFSCNEAQNLVDDLEGLRRHRVTVAGENTTEERNRARGNCIVTHSSRANLGEFTRKVSEHVEPEKFGPDRFLVASFYAHPLATALGFEGVAHFSLHPDATVKNRPLDAPIVREYRESLDSTRRAMQFARDDGLLLVLTGDLQVTARFNRQFGPRPQIAGPLDLNSRVMHIDWILYDRALKLSEPLETRKLFDHLGFVATFTANNARRNR